MSKIGRRWENTPHVYVFCLCGNVRCLGVAAGKSLLLPLFLFLFLSVCCCECRGCLFLFFCRYLDIYTYAFFLFGKKPFINVTFALLCLSIPRYIYVCLLSVWKKNFRQRHLRSFVSVSIHSFVPLFPSLHFHYFSSSSSLTSSTPLLPFSFSSSFLPSRPLSIDAKNAHITIYMSSK